MCFEQSQTTICDARQLRRQAKWTTVYKVLEKHYRQDQGVTPYMGTDWEAGGTLKPWKRWYTHLSQIDCHAVHAYRSRKTAVGEWNNWSRLRRNTVMVVIPIRVRTTDILGINSSYVILRKLKIPKKPRYIYIRRREN